MTRTNKYIIDGNKIDGKAIAQNIKDEVKKVIEERCLHPRLAVIQVGNNPASTTYVNNKNKACEYCGIQCITKHMEEDVSEEHLIEEIMRLNEDIFVDGILVQLPLPTHINEQRVLSVIDPNKDVDCFGDENLGRIVKNARTADKQPCTPSGIMKMLDFIGFDYSGKNAVMIGRSNIVGKPMALMLLARDMNVTVLHSKTPKEQLKKFCKNADLIVIATGHMNTLTEEHFGRKKPVIIDVGINRDENGKLCGDVSEEVKKKYSKYYSPVPSGSGLLTVAMLMFNTLKSHIHDIHEGEI